MIEPTVGRVVWYWPAPGAPFATVPSQPLAAQVAAVWNARLVNIGFLDANGCHQNATSVKLHQEGDEKPAFGYVEWMPYQVGQAKAVVPTDTAATVAPQPPKPAEAVHSRPNTLSLKGKRR